MMLPSLLVLLPALPLFVAQNAAEAYTPSIVHLDSLSAFVMRRHRKGTQLLNTEEYETEFSKACKSYPANMKATNVTSLGCRSDT
jgi:hypothetical protein